MLKFKIHFKIAQILNKYNYAVAKVIWTVILVRRYSGINKNGLSSFMSMSLIISNLIKE